MTPRLLLIDNYDSFTYNLVQAFRILGAEVTVYRNDAISVADAVALSASHLVISPGPGRPEDAGISMALIEALAGQMPILGVCLGHQCIAQVFGGEIIGAKVLMHGKTSWVRHDGGALYHDLNNPLEAGRYHSLAAAQTSIPAVMEICATTEDGEVMGLRHRDHAIEGVQFHPESVLTPQGDLLMNNFLKMTSP
jgi:anthranilate synthase/aminodeoxychorismate synthase-like glutamine amidotransferase